MNLCASSYFRISRLPAFSISYPFLRHPSPRFFSRTVILRTIEMEAVDTSGPLAKLRELMRQQNVDVYSKLNFLILLPRSGSVGHAHVCNQFVVNMCSLSCAVHSCALRRQPSVGIYSTVWCTPRWVRCFEYPITSFTNPIFLSSFYFWFHRLRRDCHHYSFQGCTVDGWSLLQSSIQTIRW